MGRKLEMKIGPLFIVWAPSTRSHRLPLISWGGVPVRDLGSWQIEQRTGQNAQKWQASINLLKVEYTPINRSNKA
jgi:hypothetical protein